MQVQDANLVINEYDKMLLQANKTIALLRAYIVEVEERNKNLMNEVHVLTLEKQKQKE